MILQPSAFDDLIKFNLTTVTLFIAPPYEALSYAWGGAKPPFLESGIIEGSILPISSALSTALRHLRKSSEERLLWIDAICINQNDEKERSAQVNFMGEIYACAKRVVVWIGPSEGDSERAMRFFREIGRRKAFVERERRVIMVGKGIVD